MEQIIKTREEISPKIIDFTKNPDEWHYGVSKKSHYSLNSNKEIIGCLNLVFMFKAIDYNIFYIDTLEVRRDVRRHGIGTHLLNQVVNSVRNRISNALFYLLVAKCEQYKLIFFSKNRFRLIKLRKNSRGAHCILTYPMIDNSEKICEQIFQYFHWKIENIKIISSNCKFAHNPNPTGLYWCEKKKIFVTGMEKETCPYYIKDSDIITKEKFLDLYENMV